MDEVHEASRSVASLPSLPPSRIALIGLLSNRPMAGVLCALPPLVWTLWLGRLRQLWQCVAWVRGGLLVAAVGAPRHVLAEVATPGFLAYFVVGEPWHRFVTAG
jgi:hypothetical protein